jgi:hypothetical protein
MSKNSGAADNYPRSNDVSYKASRSCEDLPLP